MAKEKEKMTDEQKEALKNVYAEQAEKFKEFAAMFKTTDESKIKDGLKKETKTKLSKPFITAYVRVYHNKDTEELKSFYDKKDRTGAREWFIKKYNIELKPTKAQKKIDLFDIEI